MSDSEVSILSKEFIEIEDPIATSITVYTTHQLPCTLNIYFDSVPTEQLNSLETKLFEVLNGVVNDGIDMERMATVIKTERDRILLDAEKKPASRLRGKLLNEALYGSLDGKTLLEEVKDLVQYELLAEWTSEQWISLLKR